MSLQEDKEIKEIKEIKENKTETNKGKIMDPIRIKSGLASATIYTITNNKDWISYCVCWRDADGKRQRRTISDLKEARAFADKKVEELEANQTISIPKAHSDYLRACEQKLNGVPLHVAIDSYLKQVTRQQHRPRNLHTCMNALLRSSIAKDLGPTARARLKSQLTRFVDAYPETTIDQISATELDNYLRPRGWSAETRAAHLAAITLLFDFAKQRHFLPSNLPTEAERAASLTYVAPHPKIYSPREMELLLTHVRKDGVPFLALGAFAGLRPAEIMALKWTDIDLEKNKICVHRKHKKRLIPISPNLKKWLECSKDGTIRVVPVQQPHKVYTLPTAKIVEKKLGRPFSWKNRALYYSFIANHLALKKDPGQTTFIAGANRPVDLAFEGRVSKAEAKQYFSIVPPTSHPASHGK